MKFVITRTSWPSYNEDNKPPCDGAKWDLVKVCGVEVMRWTVKVSTLEGLIALAKENGGDVILWVHQNEIEIYDALRE